MRMVVIRILFLLFFSFLRDSVRLGVLYDLVWGWIDVDTIVTLFFFFLFLFLFFFCYCIVVVSSLIRTSLLFTRIMGMVD